jgi:hypothetical protein
VLALPRAPTSRARLVVASVRAVLVAVIAVPAHVPEPPAVIPNALKLPKTVHREPDRRELDRPRGLVRQRSRRTRPLAATQGSEGSVSGPNSFVRSRGSSSVRRIRANYPIRPGCSDSHGFRWLPTLRPSFRERPWDGYFVRAENLGRLADLLDERARDPDFRGDPYFAYGGRSLHERSHGEGFIALFEHRLQAGGILLMDEPEAALSPQRQLSLLAQLHAFIASGQTQMIIATHSPILMTFPGATLLEIRDGALEETTLAETSHYQITRGILEAPERYWKHLRGEGGA